MEREAMQEYRELRRFIFWLVATSLPVTAMIVALGLVSGSLSLFAVLADYGITLLINAMMLFTLSRALRQNRFTHPHGTGKLENFAGMLYGVCIVPMAAAMLVAAVERYRHPPATIAFGPALLYIVAIARLAVIAWWVTRLYRRYPDRSPLLAAYHVDYRAGLINETGIFAGLVAGYLIERLGAMAVAVQLDLAVASLLAGYLLWYGVGLVRRNLQALLDLPLEEADQLAILAALGAEFMAYDGVENIYTNLSGSTRIVQVELQFDGKMTVAEIEALRGRVERRLQARFGRMVFHLIPRQLKGGG